MKKAKGLEYAPRDRPKRRPGTHTKSINKNKPKTKKKYRGQGR